MLAAKFRVRIKEILAVNSAEGGRRSSVNTRIMELGMVGDVDIYIYISCGFVI
jgi:Fe2+ transport system protein FeoA